MHTCAAYEGNVYDALLIICCTAYMSNTCSTTYKLHISFLHIWHAKAYMPKMCTAYKFIIHISFLYDAYKKCFIFCILRIYVSYMTNICFSTAFMLHICIVQHIYATHMLYRIYAPHMVSRIYSRSNI